MVYSVLSVTRRLVNGLITSAGFRDLLEIGRQKRPDLYDLQTDKPPVLVERSLRREVPEPQPLQTRRPLYAAQPLITTIAVTDSPSNMVYHSLQLTGRKRMSGGLELTTSYTLSKTLTDNRGFYGGGPNFINGEGAYWQDAYNRTSERGRAFFDARHNFNFGGSWDVPVGKTRTFGKNMSRVADWIAGGWNGGFLIVSHSGFPVTILGLDSTNQAVRGNVRPNRYRADDSLHGTGTACGRP